MNSIQLPLYDQIRLYFYSLLIAINNAITTVFFSENCECEDCDTNVLPALAAPGADPNCKKCKPRKSQLCGVYFDADGIMPMDSWDEAGVVDWATANLDNTAADNSKVKYLVIQGGISDPEEVTETVGKNKEVVIERTYTQNWTVKCLDDYIRAFLVKIQECGYDGKIWYEDLGCYLYGGANGIQVLSIKPKFPHGAGEDDIMSAQIEVKYKLCKEPDRIENPLATS